METSGLCTKCVMDVSAKEITFDEQGVCNFCHQAEAALNATNVAVWNHDVIAEVKDPDNEYDCIMGLSGGVDSSYTLYKAVQKGLRPLCFSIDTGYNKPDADENIMRLVEGLRVPFFRYTIDLPRFKELQAAFMRAGVRNIEIPTDHVLMAASYEMAAEYGVKTILSGGNVATESIMPPSWGHNARDLTHIKAIYKQFTGKRLQGLPTCSLLKWNIYKWWYEIKTIYLLDTIEYNRLEAEQELIEKFGFKSTGEKHEENYFTWWFQNFYLFEKFGIDKRKAHYSSLINSDQMTREEALARVHRRPVYPELGIETKVMKYPSHEHSAYPMDKWYDRIAYIVNLCKY